MTTHHHPLSPQDGEVNLVFRPQILPMKGALKGAQAREPFAHIMEQVLDAPGVDYVRGAVGGVSGVWCRPAASSPKAAILYLHGGAFVFGSAWAYRHLAGQIAARAEVDVFVPDYRQAPEHPFPAAIIDAKAAFAGLAAGGRERIALVGDSAGGGLALSLIAELSAKRARPTVQAVGVAVFSPWTDLTLSGESLQARAAADPIFTRDNLAQNAQLYLSGANPHDPRVSPLLGQLAGLPPVQIHVGEDEVLLDDARRYGDRARQVGGQVEVHVWEGMAHVFPASVGMLEAADRGLALAGAFLKSHLGVPVRAPRLGA